MQLLYKLLFRTGYAALLILSILPTGGNLSGKNVASIRLDYLVLFGVYLLICIYYLAGKLLGYRLFEQKALRKFLMAVLLLAIITEVVQL